MQQVQNRPCAVSDKSFEKGRRAWSNSGFFCEGDDHRESETMEDERSATTVTLSSLIILGIV
jgi:hypothetical protein